MDDIGYLVSYAALGLAGLRGSMAALSAEAPVTVFPWRRLRLLAVGGSLGLPATLGVASGADTAMEGVVYTGCAIMLVGLVCWRLVTSVNRHAASEARLAHSATHDALTGLPNRSKMVADIDATVRRSAGGGVAVVLLDIDRFKDLNGGWGHDLGDEVLVSADGTSIPTAEFIPIAEETGLIIPLGAQALVEATRFLALCRAMHPELDLDFSVNLSPRQLREPGLVETIREAIAVSGIPARCLCVEIPESALVAGGGAIMDGALAAVRDLGVQIATDDFGTGYSALLYLERFGVGRLKIDLAFVHGLGASLYDGAIVAGIVAIAKKLRLDVIAEGVETPNQVERLRALGCRAGQGFIFGPAMPADEAMSSLDTPLQPAARAAARASVRRIAPGTD